MNSRPMILSRKGALLLAVWCGMAAEALAGGEWVFRSQVTNPEARADALVQITDPHGTIEVPRGAFLEYDLFFSPENVSFGGGVCVITRKGSVIKDPCPKDEQGVTTHLEGGSHDLERLAKGQWYHRRISLDFLSGVPATEIFLAASAGYASKAGRNEVHYRNIRLTDKEGRELKDLMPRLGGVTYPLITSAPYVHDVTMEASGVIAGSFEPSRYLLSSDQKFGGNILLKNFDPVNPAIVSYALTIDRSDGTGITSQPIAAEVRLEPGAEVSVPVTLLSLEPGNYRSHLHLVSGNSDAIVESCAITSLTKEALAGRKKPFSPGGFGMGAVNIIGGGSAQALPLLRELGANYYQLRLEWAQIETMPGLYDTSSIQPFIDMARRCGMWLEIDLYSGFPAYSVPRWYWDDTMESNTGRKNMPKFCPISYWGGAREKGLKALQALLSQCKGAEEVVSWNAWQGGNMDSFYAMLGSAKKEELQDYSPWSQEKFREYVRTVLQLSLEDAAKRYNLPLQSWNDLHQPAPQLDHLDLTPLWNDFMAYRLWSVGMVQKEASEIITGKVPNAVSEYMYGGSLGSLGRNGNDFDAGVRNAVAFKGSIHHTASPGAENQIYLGTAHRQFGVPFSIETAGTPASPPDHQHAVFELLSQNASVFTYIQWTGAGLISIPKEDYGFGEFRPALERMGNARPIRHSVAIVFPYANMLIDPFEKELQGTKMARGFIRRMETVGYDADVYTDRTSHVSWSDYPVVVAPFSSALSSEFVAEMVTYVKNGGKLILLSNTGEYTPGDETGRFALFKALGCDVPDARKSTVIGKPRAIFSEGDLTHAEVALSDWHPMPTLPQGAGILALDKEGAPAVATWPLGKGEVMMWAGWPDLNTPISSSQVSYGKSGSSATEVTLFPTAFDKVLERFAGVGLPMSCATPDVLFALRKENDHFFVILLNNSSRKATALLNVPLPSGKYHSFHLTRMVGRGSLTSENNAAGFSVDLEPLEVAVIELSPQDIEAPTLDFPLRSRTIFPAATAWSGETLQKMFQSAPSVQRDARGNVKVPDGAVLNLLLPSPGRYKLHLKTSPGAPPLILQSASGTTLPLVAGESSDGIDDTVDIESQSEHDTLIFPKGLALEWMGLTPSFHPLGPALVSPAQENPGVFPGQNFEGINPMEATLLEGGTLPAAAGWKKVTPLADGTINVAEATGKAAGLAYALWSVESPEAHNAMLGLGVDYGVKLWLNGEMVFDSTKVTREGPPKPNEFLLPVRLRKGSNIFLAKTASGSDGWYLQLNSNMLAQAP